MWLRVNEYLFCGSPDDQPVVNPDISPDHDGTAFAEVFVNTAEQLLGLDGRSLRDSTWLNEVGDRINDFVL